MYKPKDKKIYLYVPSRNNPYKKLMDKGMPQKKFFSGPATKVLPPNPPRA